MSANEHIFEIDMMKFIIEKSLNLEALFVGKMVVSNHCLREVCALKNLRVLSLVGCSKISDKTITRIFKECQYIESIDLTLNYSLTGECFNNAPDSLITLVIDHCDKVNKQY